MTTGLIVIAAVILLAVILQDAFEVMLLPRRIFRRFRLTRLYFVAAWAIWSTGARQLPPGPRREGVLSVFGALAMIVLFAIWAAALITGFGALEWAFQPQAPASIASSTSRHISARSASVAARPLAVSKPIT